MTYDPTEDEKCKDCNILLLCYYAWVVVHITD